MYISFYELKICFFLRGSILYKQTVQTLIKFRLMWHFICLHTDVYYQIVAGGILCLLALNLLYYRFPKVARTLGKSILTRMDLDICKVVSQIIGFTCISMRQSSGNNY